MQKLTKSEFLRYSRHVILPDIGVEGQLKLKQSKVIVVGAGGLGVPVLIYLAAAGVGEIGIVDFDQVSISNLQRQVIYKVKDVGALKVDKAKEFVSELNPEIQINIHNSAIDSSNAFEIIEPYDFIIDGTDNFPTRYLLNDTAIFLGKPYIYGSIFRFEGQVSVFNYLQKDGSRSPNYRDLFPEPPHPDLVPNCAEGGVLGVLPGIVGSLQALEAIKLITGIGEILAGQLLTIDTLSNQYRTFKFKSRKDNPITGVNPTIKALIDYDAFCNAALANEPKKEIKEMDVKELAKWIKQQQSFQLIDVREPYEYEISNLGGELMPKSAIGDYINKISRDLPVVVYCRSGKRSAEVIEDLSENHGFENLINLTGGLLAYSDQIDERITKY